jgi:ketosteroid isomerase-like protein
MLDRAAVEKLVMDAYAARNARDLEAIMRMFRPDASFRLAGSAAAFPGAVEVRGEAQLRAAFEGLMQAFDFLEQKLVTSVIEGSRAAVQWQVRLRHNPTGKVVDTELFDLWTIDGGRIASLVQFCDTALVAGLMAR